jgi:structural maintenance of chromosome 4
MFNNATHICFISSDYYFLSYLNRQRTKDLEQITIERDLIRVEYETLRRQRLDEFMKGFDVISLKLKEMYQMITLGKLTTYCHCRITSLYLCVRRVSNHITVT